MTRGVQHVHEHRLVARRHQHHVRQAAQVGDVEGAVVGRAVVADEPGAVHREHDVQLLEADVVDDLVEAALEEGRVDRGDRLRALEREPGGEQDGVLLGDADVVVAVGQRLLEDVEPGARVHRGGDADDALVALGTPPRARCRRRPCTGAAAPAGRRSAAAFFGAGARSTIERRLGGVPLLHALEAAVLGGREALALDGLARARRPGGRRRAPRRSPRAGRPRRGRRSRRRRRGRAPRTAAPAPRRP